jgi:hypothetical protein
MSEFDDEQEKKIAEDLFQKILSPPFGDDDLLGDAECLAWIEEINEIIQTKLDFYSLCNLMQISTKNDGHLKGYRMAGKRHAENRSMKADVFIWLDSQPKFKSIEDAATAITKQQPIKHVTGRDWFKEWKKLRSAGTP